MRPHGRLRGRPQGGEGRWDAVRALSSRPFCSCDSRWGSLGYLSAGLRYTTRTTVPFLTQEVFEFVHQLLRVKVVLTP